MMLRSFNRLARILSSQSLRPGAVVGSGAQELSLNTIRRLSSVPEAQAESHGASKQSTSYEPGQPTHTTHPWLLRQGDITPGIQSAEYAARRQRLCSVLPKGAIVVLGAAPTIYMAGIIPYGNYRQDPDVFYLTGISQNHCVVVLQADESKAEGSSSSCRYMLFLDPPDEERARWDGARMDFDAACKEFGADEVYPMSDLPAKLSLMCKTAPIVLHDSDRTTSHMHASTSMAVRSSHAKVMPLKPVMHTMRMLKSPSEAALMRASAQISAEAIDKCMGLTHPGVPEFALAAAFEYECKVRGAARMAYPQVVAAGRDACTIHYGRNDKRVGAEDLILMDAGCELHGYVSDVTRTWPASGRFSGAQRDVYEVVLAAHNACVDACKPGSSIRDLHFLSVKILSEGIQQLGLVKGASLDAILQTHYRTFFWHSLGHWLGLDTHDTPTLGHDKQLRPGAVITIEPGLYIPDDEQYGNLRGIGVRIEDDVLVTQGGCEVLSKHVPTAVSEVEARVGLALNR